MSLDAALIGSAALMGLAGLGLVAASGWALGHGIWQRAMLAC